MKRSDDVRSDSSVGKSTKPAPGMWPAPHAPRPDSTRKPPSATGSGTRFTVHSSTRTAGSPRRWSSQSVETRYSGWAKLMAISSAPTIGRRPQSSDEVHRVLARDPHPVVEDPAVQGPGGIDSPLCRGAGAGGGRVQRGAHQARDDDDVAVRLHPRVEGPLDLGGVEDVDVLVHHDDLL